MMKEQELMHYGVIGMKWGVRRGRAAQSYSKGVKKLQKLEAKEKKAMAKSDKHAAKSGFGLTEFSRDRRRKSAEMATKARKYALQGEKVYKQMSKAFKDTPVSQLNKSDMDYIKRYSDRLTRQ